MKNMEQRIKKISSVMIKRIRRFETALMGDRGFYWLAYDAFVREYEKRV